MEIVVKLDNSIFRGVIRMKGLEFLQKNGKRGIRDSEYNKDHSFKEYHRISCFVCGPFLVSISSEEFVSCKERLIRRCGTWRS